MLRTWSAGLLTVSLFATASLLVAQDTIGRVYADAGKNVHVVLGSGKDVMVAPEKDQADVDEIKVADDRQTAGWFVLYKERVGGGTAETEVGTPFAGKLIVWRGARIIRRFVAAQAFWSWAFEHGGAQVAYHGGPMHGETVSHCELRDVQSGRRLASWDGNLDDPLRPAWTRNLDH